MSNSTIVANKIVLMHYTLTTNEGEVLDSSREGEPLPYLHGHANIVPGLEAALEGKSAGEKLKVVVTPEEGYGVRQDIPPQPVERTAFPADLDIQEGMQFFAEGPDGSPIPVWVEGLEEGTVLITGNHPLSGVTLNFDVEIVSISDASDEEIAHGHVHGPGGHHH